MKFKEFLTESDVKSVLTKIVKIFDEVLDEGRYSYEYEAKGHYFGSNGVTIQFWRIDKDRIEQTATVYLKDHDGKFDLHLEDVYIPEEMKNKGYMTEVLTLIRKLPELSGRCKVHVAVNTAWKKIIERSGFEWL